MTRARRSLHVLSCFRPEDLDVTRLSHGAVDFYELLDREIAGNSDLGSPRRALQPASRLSGPTPSWPTSGTGSGPGAHGSGTSTTAR